MNNISLKQGTDFYRNKTKLFRKPNNIVNENEIEGFDNMNSLSFGTKDMQLTQTDNTNKLSKESKLTLNKTELNRERFILLQNQYNEILEEIKKVKTEMMKKTLIYNKRINPKHNRFLNKNIRFGGVHMYVNELGIAQWYGGHVGSMRGKKGCPNEAIDTGLRWREEYKRPGAIIPTDPPLITGEPLERGQVCGGAGKNVYASNFLSEMERETTYLGSMNNIDNIVWSGGGPPENIPLANTDVGCPKINKDSFWYLPLNYNLCGIYAAYGSVIILNSSNAWGYPYPYPTGDQCMCLQGNSTLTITSPQSQPFDIEPNTNYYISFYMCGRNCCGGYNANPLKVGFSTSTTQESGSYEQFWANNGATVTPEINKWTHYISPAINIGNGWGGNKLYPIINGTGCGGDCSSGLCGFKLVKGSAGGGDYDFDLCKKASIVAGYKYFSLSGYNKDTGYAYCGLTNNRVNIDQAGKSMAVTGKTVLWSADVDGGSYAKLETSGQISVYDSSDKVIWQSSIPENQKSWGNYYGSYRDSHHHHHHHHHKKKKYDIDSCRDKANDKGNTIFGLYDPDSSGKGQCFSSSDLNNARSLGRATNTQMVKGMPSGGGGSNSVYGVNPGFDCFLIAQDDGNLVIYRGQNPSDNQGVIWASKTRKKQKAANPDQTSSNSVNGNNYMTTGQTLSSGQFLANDKGTIVLEWNNGKLELVTFEMGPNEMKTNDGQTAAGPGGNAFYELKGQSQRNEFGKLAYIDDNNQVREYPNKDFNFTDEYTELNDVNWAPGNNIGDEISNTNEEDCKQSCNQKKNCAGFVINGSNCWLKNAKSRPLNLSISRGTTTYQRNKEPRRRPPGIEGGANPISTTQFHALNLGNSPHLNMNEKYGLAKVNAVYESKLSNLENRLKAISSEMGENDEIYHLNSKKVINQMNQNQKGTNDNMKLYFNMLAKIKELSSQLPNQERIASETDIIVLQENYRYTLYSIIAIGAVVVLLNLPKKQ